MYNQFFGFKERPFRLVPNPGYLYLSRSHEEALGHLNYAVSQGEGFVEITGEVGTGKTTLCRQFLENLDRSTEAAYIFNPKLDSIQLLKEINSEFGISADGSTTRDLIETLNTFLMDKRKDGKKVILLIDEAQNLSEDVLEQLRLLSNLETTTSKLIQIILVGQPELGDMLDSHELRQLSQRITLRCHLKPLTLKETKEYIEHRIRIASHKPGVRFTGGAFRMIYQYSSGIPRKINIICDRALLTGFTLNRHKISHALVKSSLRELEGGRGGEVVDGFSKKKSAALLISLICILLLIIFVHNGLNQDHAAINLTTETHLIKGVPERNDTVSEPIGKTEENGGKKPWESAVKEADQLGETIDTDVAAPMDPDEDSESQDDRVQVEEAVLAVIRDVDIQAMLYAMDTMSSRNSAFRTALSLWGEKPEHSRYLEGMEDDNEFFRLSAKQKGFMCSRIEGDVDVLRTHNVPAILELYPDGGLSPKFIAVKEIGDGSISLHKDEGTLIVVPVSTMEKYWSGTAYLIWKNFFNYSGVIPINATRDSILTLKIHLRKIGFDNVAISPFYDETALDAVKTIQEKNRLKVDGIVGPITMIALYNEDDTLNIPHISNPAPGNKGEGGGEGNRSS